MSAILWMQLKTSEGNTMTNDKGHIYIFANQLFKEYVIISIIKKGDL